jgi:DNA polymerase/3'-5' exonuclease PolX
MKFGELMVLFWAEMDNIKANADTVNAARFVLIAYNNVLKKIQDTYSNSEIATEDRINALQITTHMREKLVKFTKIKLTKKIKDQEKINTIKKKLNDVLGIGDKKADDLIASGVTSINQLKQKKYFNTLNTDTQMTLMHDITRGINLAVVQKFADKLTNYNNNINKIVIVGSYRRNKPVVRDIDILFCTKSKNDVEDYLAHLKKIFNNNVFIYADGENKISFIIQPDPKVELKYKADIFVTTPDNYNSTLLYATGSQFNNIKMRARAKRMGLLLNQNGIFKNGKKINKPSDTERRLFEILELPYLEPDKRY